MGLFDFVFDWLFWFLPNKVQWWLIGLLLFIVSVFFLLVWLH